MMEQRSPELRSASELGRLSSFSSWLTLRAAVLRQAVSRSGGRTRAHFYRLPAAAFEAVASCPQATNQFKTYFAAFHLRRRSSLVSVVACPRTLARTSRLHSMCVPCASTRRYVVWLAVVIGGVCGASLRLHAWPNPSLKPSPNGGPPGPGCRYAVHFRQPGPGVPPSVPA
jgi:hypothetical protein